MGNCVERALKQKAPLKRGESNELEEKVVFLASLGSKKVPHKNENNQKQRENEVKMAADTSLCLIDRLEQV